MRGAFANSRLALKLRRRRGRFGIFAPRVAVRTHVSWHWWALAALVASIVSAVLFDQVFDAGRRFAGFDRNVSERELDVLRDRNTSLEQEVQRLRGLADASESRLQIEIAAEQQLARQVKTLEEEIARLKDDLSVFESLAVAEGGEGSLSINRLRVEADGGAANQYRYRMLLAVQGGGKGREFKGNLQLALDLQQQGRHVMMLLPPPAEQDSPQYTIGFKHFRRIDGTFTIPAGARIKSAEIRLLQGGAVKASKIVSL